MHTCIAPLCVLTSGCNAPTPHHSTMAAEEQVSGFLKKVELLQSMSQRDITRLADALETQTFAPGGAIMAVACATGLSFVPRAGTAMPPPPPPPVAHPCMPCGPR